VRLLDFVRQAEPSRLTINRWVELKTENRIKDLLKPGTISADTRAVLVNAIYFSAAWATQFKPETTRSGTFHNLSGSTSTVPMMYGPSVQAKAARKTPWGSETAAELPGRVGGGLGAALTTLSGLRCGA
jgi:serpin B